MSPLCIFPQDLNTGGRPVRPHSAAMFGNDSSMRSAIERGEKVDLLENGWTPLHLAVWNMHLNVVKVLLMSPTPGIATENLYGWTALHLASWNNDVEIIELLLQAGADVSACDNDGYSPVHHAASNQSVDAIRVLVEAGANVSARSCRDGLTAMHIAAKTGCVKSIDALLELGADISVRAEDGRRPIHYAALDGNVGVIRSLMGAGADVYDLDRDGNSAMHYANETVAAEIRKLLEEEQGSVSVSDDEGSISRSIEALKEVGDRVGALSIGSD